MFADPLSAQTSSTPATQVTTGSPAGSPTGHPPSGHATSLRAADRPSNLSAGLAPLEDVAKQIAELDDAIAALQSKSSAAQPGPIDKKLAALRAQLAAFEPSVTLLGQVKSGKTTLVNAMAGWADLLPSDVTPWTSVVTSLHLRPKGHATAMQTSASFRFMTAEEWDRLLHKGGRIGEMAGRAGAESELQKIQTQITEMRHRAETRLGRKFELLMGQSHDYGYFDKNLIERYICLGDDFGIDDRDPEATDAQGRFADITRSADLYLGSDSLPCGLCLRDTPGVNDTFMMREQITIQALRDSSLCVVVLSAAQALSSVDLGLIRMLSTLQAEQAVIFVNRIDELADPAAQIPEIEASLRATLRTALRDGQSGDPVLPQILFGSAYWAARVLTGETEAMVPASSSALLNWAEHSARAPDAPERLTAVSSAQEMIWELSGLPALFEALSDRIATREAQPMLQQIAESAITLASAQEAAQGVAIAGTGSHGATAPLADLLPNLEALAARHLHALDAEVDTVLTAFAERADRAHATFVERATHALIAHLEDQGEGRVWSYDPAGLRILLRGAYSVMGTRVQNVARKRYEAAVTDAAGLLFDHFGEAVAGIRLAVPEPPAPGAPVALAQAIALDFNDSWWTGWWRRMRGYQAFAKTFRRLIEGETEDFMHQLKTVQTETLRRDMRARLAESLHTLCQIAAQIQEATDADPRAMLADDNGDTPVRHAALQVLLRHAQAPEAPAP
ncbi:ribosome-associated GTPase EngA [Tritonibacter multivorans]|uniref:Ribosome-associated GTPase EngA n=1 Tax=Tritonibacter multivorans TaxID=928856 RepID=A0A0P1G1G0_9RHOB|nr:dynamin family protein [Tritonibacter multivorans]MDA7419392.1 dynamin family protein [Tritonibacter multivorans]CUH75373.1 ribosome-associated GTPase EngA [Tritonibacter multivorans]SFD20550.1 Dynamin family protein [Tritonibacter multivorans]